MASVAQKFWLMIVPSLTGVSATGLLILAALFPEQLFSVNSAGYIATAALALVSVGIVVWQLAVGGGTPGTMERPEHQQDR
jgi:hypothetical protein